MKITCVRKHCWHKKWYKFSVFDFFLQVRIYKFDSSKKEKYIKKTVYGKKTCLMFILTLAKSILSVQHPEYISAPLRLSRARAADSNESNVLKEAKWFLLRKNQSGTLWCKHFFNFFLFKMKNHIINIKHTVKIPINTWQISFIAKSLLKFFS